MSSTAIAYGTVCLRTCYARPSTNPAYRASSLLSESGRALLRTDLGDASTRSYGRVEDEAAEDGCDCAVSVSPDRMHVSVSPDNRDHDRPAQPAVFKLHRNF
eukprot:1702815-Rhodomonas_salina.1